jgi:predicted nucleic acid-binding Zn ribbon protein
MTENIKKIRFCLFCNKEISEFRRKDSVYCSDLCKGRNFERKNPDRKMYLKEIKTQKNNIKGVGIDTEGGL